MCGNIFQTIIRQIQNLFLICQIIYSLLVASKLMPIFPYPNFHCISLPSLGFNSTPVRCILESSSRCPNILTVVPPNNLVLPVPCRPPIIPVCGRTYHAVCLKSRWAGSYETEFMGDGRKLSFPWRYSFSLNEIMYRYIGFGFILPYEATKQSSSINNCSIIPTESCWARS